MYPLRRNPSPWLRETLAPRVLEIPLPKARKVKPVQLEQPTAGNPLFQSVNRVQQVEPEPERSEDHTGAKTKAFNFECGECICVTLKKNGMRPPHSNSNVLVFAPGVIHLLPTPMRSVDELDSKQRAAPEPSKYTAASQPQVNLIRDLKNRDVPEKFRTLPQADSVAALLEFFQPYPRDAENDKYAIEDAFFDDVTVLPLEYLRVPKFHLMEWYANIGRHIPMFHGVAIGRVLCEPDDLGGPDTFVIWIPLGETELHEQISEETLLNSRLDLVGWVLKRQEKVINLQHGRRDLWTCSQCSIHCGILFNEPDLEKEGEFIVFSGCAQIPADGVKGLSRTASTPRVKNRLVARPLVIVVRVNGEPRRELEDPITLQLAVQGSRSKINHSVNVKFSYQDIDEEHNFLLANLSGYDMILGTA
ncbi:hypothetical protein B0H19DRAFT_1084901 [Mycena capillaripes]|nr:hypothetical protein B0H19DRAFT_1084901 [Mycena capillaripes]